MLHCFSPFKTNIYLLLFHNNCRCRMTTFIQLCPILPPKISNNFIVYAKGEKAMLYLYFQHFGWIVIVVVI